MHVCHRASFIACLCNKDTMRKGFELSSFIAFFAFSYLLLSLFSPQKRNALCVVAMNMHLNSSQYQRGVCFQIDLSFHLGQTVTHLSCNLAVFTVIMSSNVKWIAKWIDGAHPHPQGVRLMWLQTASNAERPFVP